MTRKKRQDSYRDSKSKSGELSSRIKPELAVKVRACAKKTDRSSMAIVNEAIERYLNDMVNDFDIVPDFENIQAGDKFIYRGLEWACLDPKFMEGDVLGVLAIATKFISEGVEFGEDNNYLNSNLRKTMKNLEEDIISEDVFIPHLVDTTDESGTDRYGSVTECVFPLSIHEYIKYAKFVPEYDEWFWLRSPTPGNAFYVRGVYTDGSLSYIDASTAYGAAPACIFNPQI